MKLNTFLSVLFSLTGLAAALPSQAAYTWNFPDGSDTGTYGNTRTYSGSGTPTPVPGVTASAWSDTSTGAALNTAYLGSYSGGLGVTNRNVDTGVPNHTLDNNVNYDSILFKFDSSIALDHVNIGWAATDTDISVLAWTGAAGTTPTTLLGQTYGALAAGWTLIGHYAGPSKSTSGETLTPNLSVAVNAAGTPSSYWLIAAYNSTFGGTCIACGSPNTNKDYVKIASLSGSTPPGKVPEPATLILMGIGLLSIVRARRQQARVASPPVGYSAFA